MSFFVLILDCKCSNYHLLLLALCCICLRKFILSVTVLPAKSDSDIMICLQSYQGLRIDRSLVY